MKQPPLSLLVLGTPRPQPRPRFIKGRAVSTASTKARHWRGAVEREARQAIELAGLGKPMFSGPVKLTAVFTFAPPPSAKARLGSRHTQTPDASNLLKLVEDALEDAGVFANDSQIAEADPQKWWGERPGVWLLVEPLEGEQRPEPVNPRKAEAPGWLTGASGAAGDG